MRNELSLCQDNFSLKPPDGILKRYTFNWLGFVQYTHVTTGLPHHTKAPRVILIHKQFVLGTASDMLELPKSYKLGNIIFGEYERDEVSCGMTRTQVKLGIGCPPAYMEVPPLDVTPHPEYSRFGVRNSLALVKLLRPMKSDYMLPVCMSSVGERDKLRRKRSVFMIDYLNNVPQDFEIERMAKRTLKLYTHNECRRHRLKAKLGSEGVTHALCTSGCGVRAGAPIISQNSEGGFELIGVAVGGASCTRNSMRQRLIKEPPIYIDVYPYQLWMINVITAHILPKTYPQNFNRVEDGKTIGLRSRSSRRVQEQQKSGWRGRTFVSGDFCFETRPKRKLTAFFYEEKFQADTDPPARIIVHMKISAGIDTVILCARLILPNKLLTPKIEGVGGYNISVHFSTDFLPSTFYYSLGLTGRNVTEKEFMSRKMERAKGFW